jgi:hypothetical protein
VLGEQPSGGGNMRGGVRHLRTAVLINAEHEEAAVNP